jgi:hypothetical protein
MVRYPGRNRHLRAEGERVPWNQYWMRRWDGGDCVTEDPNAEKPVKKTGKKSAKKGAKKRG